MSGEGARSGVKRPRPRARIACEPTPATQTIPYWGLGWFEVSSLKAPPSPLTVDHLRHPLR